MQFINIFSLIVLISFKKAIGMTNEHMDSKNNYQTNIEENKSDDDFPINADDYFCYINRTSFSIDELGYIFDDEIKEDTQKDDLVYISEKTDKYFGYGECFVSKKQNASTSQSEICLNYEKDDYVMGVWNSKITLDLSFEKK